MADTYAAKVVEVPGEGIRLVPTRDSALPEQPNDVNLLGMSVALALGAAAYEHHPAPRDPELQTLDALLAGETTMPWRARPGRGGTASSWRSRSTRSRPERRSSDRTQQLLRAI